MNIEIRTGFEKISHKIPFQPQTVSKGEKLNEAGHCRQVVEHRCNGNSYLIEANMIRQASVSAEPYSVKLWISSTREVVKVSCTCVYGTSLKCKHVAGLISYVNSDQSKTKTSSEQVWGKPSDKKFVQVKYSKGIFFFQMFPSPPPTSEYHSIPLCIDEVSTPSASRQMLLAEIAQTKVEYAVPRLISDILDKVENILKDEEKALEKSALFECVEACVQTFFFNVQEYKVYKNFNFRLLSSTLQNYYFHNISKTEVQIIKMCCETVDQSSNIQWKKERRLRISASSKVHKIKVRTNKTVESLVLDFIEDKTTKSKSLEYGIRNETKAKEVYEKLNHCKIYPVGVIISERQPWLCASLDGVVVKNDMIIKIVEIKCPISCEKVKVIDTENKKSNVNYFAYSSDQIYLKRSHVYFTQCQVQLYVTGMSECDLFVYSPVENGHFTYTVFRDENFIQDIILKSEYFYFNYYLPALYDKSEKQRIQKFDNSALGTKRTFTGQNIANCIEV